MPQTQTVHKKKRGDPIADEKREPFSCNLSVSLIRKFTLAQARRGIKFKQDAVTYALEEWIAKESGDGTVQASPGTRVMAIPDSAVPAVEAILKALGGK